MTPIVTGNKRLGAAPVSAALPCGGMKVLPAAPMSRVTTCPVNVPDPAGIPDL